MLVSSNYLLDLPDAEHTKEKPIRRSDFRLPNDIAGKQSRLLFFDSFAFLYRITWLIILCGSCFASIGGTRLVFVQLHLE